MAVVAHPTFRKLPKCALPLQTKEGQKAYDTNARLLFDAGRLTHATHQDVSLYASFMDTITMKAAAGQAAPAYLIDRARKSFRALGLHEDSQPIAAPVEEKTNRFARFGAPARRRQEVQAGSVRS